MFVSLIRKLQTDDPLDFNIPILKQFPMIYLLGKTFNTESAHTTEGTFQAKIGYSTATAECHY